MRTRPGQGGIGEQWRYRKDRRTEGLREELGGYYQLYHDNRITLENKVGLSNKIESLSREVERREGRR